MKTSTFFISTAKDVAYVNLIVQTVKNNNSTTQFTNAQKAAVITAGTNVINDINSMRQEIYGAQTPPITESFGSYSDTAAGATGIYTQVNTDVRSMRNEFSEAVAEMTSRYTHNTLEKIVDDINNLIIVKSGTYTTAQTNAITAIAALQTALFV